MPQAETEAIARPKPRGKAPNLGSPQCRGEHLPKTTARRPGKCCKAPKQDTNGGLSLGLRGGLLEGLPREHVQVEHALGAVSRKPQRRVHRRAKGAEPRKPLHRVESKTEASGLH